MVDLKEVHCYQKEFITNKWHENTTDVFVWPRLLSVMTAIHSARSLCTLESVTHADQYWINKSCYSFTNIPQGSLPGYLGENFQIKSYFLCFMFFCDFYSWRLAACMHVITILFNILWSHFKAFAAVRKRNTFIVINNGSKLVILSLLKQKIINSKLEMCILCFADIVFVSFF